VIKKHRIICKCHGVSGSCSLVTCWQQLSTIREIGECFKFLLLFSIIYATHFSGDFLREKYEQATQVKMNKRGRLQVKDTRFKVPTALDLVYLDESPDWCRVNKQLQWTGECQVYSI
jgi:wingless-type MMTV integration site family, member 5